MTIDVFISYQRDDKPYAEGLAHALAERGYSVWWDVDLLSGQDFSDEIAEVIRQSRGAIVLWSERSVRSRFVKDEAGR
ncbi:MAG: toll/interleukin-1 receptor domain-containing protein, partial [Pseudomonadota bacterium]